MRSEVPKKVRDAIERYRKAVVMNVNHRNGLAILRRYGFQGNSLSKKADAAEKAEQQALANLIEAIGEMP